MTDCLHLRITHILSIHDNYVEFYNPMLWISKIINQSIKIYNTHHLIYEGDNQFPICGPDDEPSTTTIYQLNNGYMYVNQDHRCRIDIYSYQTGKLLHSWLGIWF